LQGREDIPLNENGKLQAMNCGLALSGKNWRVIVTSTLSRAKQSADIIADILNIHEIYEDADLVERDCGNISGLTEKELIELFPDGKYEGIEDWEALRDRVYNAVIRYADKFYPDDIIIVSHGGAINSILAELSNHTIGSGKTRLKNACVNMLEYKTQSLSILFYNKSFDEL